MVFYKLTFWFILGILFTILTAFLLILLFSEFVPQLIEEAYDILVVRLLL